MSRIQQWTEQRGMCPECGSIRLSCYRLGDATVCDDCGHEEIGMERMRFVQKRWPEYAPRYGRPPAHDAGWWRKIRE